MSNERKGLEKCLRKAKAKERVDNLVHDIKKKLGSKEYINIPLFEHGNQMEDKHRSMIDDYIIHGKENINGKNRL